MIPGRLLRNRRAVDNAFDDDERLFHACSNEWLDPQTRRLTPENIRFGHNSLSVNRERYSEPEDVLLPEDRRDFGVVSFRVSEVPTDKWTPEGKDAATYQLEVAHEPEEQNYAHSELQIHRNGSFDRRRRVAKSYGQLIRQQLSEASTLIIEPSV